MEKIKGTFSIKKEFTGNKMEKCGEFWFNKESKKWEAKISGVDYIEQGETSGQAVGRLIAWYLEKSTCRYCLSWYEPAESG